MLLIVTLGAAPLDGVAMPALDEADKAKVMETSERSEGVISELRTGTPTLFSTSHQILCVCPCQLECRTA